MIQTVHTIRNGIFEVECHFNGSFKDQQAKNTSHSLLMLLDLIMSFNVSETHHSYLYVGSSIAKLFK